MDIGAILLILFKNQLLLGNQATNCPIDYSFSENHVIGLFAVVCC